MPKDFSCVIHHSFDDQSFKSTYFLLSVFNFSIFGFNQSCSHYECVLRSQIRSDNLIDSFVLIIDFRSKEKCRHANNEPIIVQEWSFDEKEICDHHGCWNGLNGKFVWNCLWNFNYESASSSSKCFLDLLGQHLICIDVIS